MFDGVKRDRTGGLVRISDRADIKGLACNVIFRAIKEVKGDDPVRAIDAALWLTGADFEIWADVAGVPSADAVKLLTKGRRNTMSQDKRSKMSVVKLFADLKPEQVKALRWHIYPVLEELHRAIVAGEKKAKARARKKIANKHNPS